MPSSLIFMKKKTKYFYLIRTHLAYRIFKFRMVLEIAFLYFTDTINRRVSPSTITVKI
jgi:hypothetical protein